VKKCREYAFNSPPPLPQQDVLFSARPVGRIDQAEPDERTEKRSTGNACASSATISRRNEAVADVGMVDEVGDMERVADRLAVCTQLKCSLVPGVGCGVAPLPTAWGNLAEHAKRVVSPGVPGVSPRARR